MKPFKVGVIGASGTIGKKFVELLAEHPWFEIGVLAASERSAGKLYKNAVENPPLPFADMSIFDAKKDMDEIAKRVDFLFCAVSGENEEVRALEEGYAKREIPVVSNNAALRPLCDVPMIIPELNPEHLSVIPFQKKRLGTKRGFCAVKSNCSLQSYLPLLYTLKKFGLEKVVVCTYQAMSGAGKTLSQMPEVQNNLIPYVPFEEEKSELEPLKILGTVRQGKIIPSKKPIITAQCTRVPIENGHTAAVFVRFTRSPQREEILREWADFTPVTQTLSLPSAPKRFITYFDDPTRPQPKKDILKEKGMTICAGRLRSDPVFDYKFVGLSHNTVRGAAGGAILLAELLAVKGYL